MTLNYTFDKGTINDFIDSNDWTNRVYFPSDLQCGIYELHYPTYANDAIPDGVDMYSGIDGTFVRHICMEEFKSNVGNKILYNVSMWNVNWPYYGINWNN